MAGAIGAGSPEDVGQSTFAATTDTLQHTMGEDRAESGSYAFPAFDDHHPPDKALIDECVHCGFCLPTCPTYVLFGEEMDSPRGRIYLMNKGLDEEPMNDEMVRHWDLCLGCMACVTACPSGVQYDKLIESTRQQVERRYERRADDKAFREMIFQFFPYPNRLRAIAAPMRLYQRFGIGDKLRRAGIMQRIPARMRAMEALLPDLPKEEKIPDLTGPVGRETPQGRRPDWLRAAGLLLPGQRRHRPRPRRRGLRGRGAQAGLLRRPLHPRGPRGGVPGLRPQDHRYLRGPEPGQRRSSTPRAAARR